MLSPGENVPVKQEWNAIKKLHVFYKSVFLKGHGNDFILSINKQLLPFNTFILGIKLEFILQHSKCKQKQCLHSKELSAL